MSDTWKDIQEEKNRKSSLQERRERRKKLMADIAQSATETSTNIIEDVKTSELRTLTTSSAFSIVSSSNLNGNTSEKSSTTPESSHLAATGSNCRVSTSSAQTDSTKFTPDAIAQVEYVLQFVLSDMTMTFPIDASVLITLVNREVVKTTDNKHPISVHCFDDLLHKLSAQQLITLSTREDLPKSESVLTIVSADTTKLGALGGREDNKKSARKRKLNVTDDAVVVQKLLKTNVESNTDSVESLLAAHTTKELVNKEINEEILQLLSKPSAKEQSLVEKFRSHGGASVQEFCQFGTENECRRSTGNPTQCDKLHFRKIINSHTDELLGDCSFLNTCFHMETCKYVHYEINTRKPATTIGSSSDVALKSNRDSTILTPPQWIQCDVRKLDMSILGKFAIIMADPPWDIHMELPYGTMGDDEMRGLDVQNLQDEGYIFLWVTGRAMELGRECLTLWGYERVDELIWVKTNQLQRIIRTGRTGHWLNHGKEHCLVGVKGEPANMNRGLDCDVIVAEVRATSHKPDEIYGIIERLAPGSRKIELFGRPHNVQPNWVTLGNQLDGVRLLDPDVVKAFKDRYPDGTGLN